MNVFVKQPSGGSKRQPGYRGLKRRRKEWAGGLYLGVINICLLIEVVDRDDF